MVVMKCLGRREGPGAMGLRQWLHFLKGFSAKPLIQFVSPPNPVNQKLSLYLINMAAPLKLHVSTAPTYRHQALRCPPCCPSLWCTRPTNLNREELAHSSGCRFGAWTHRRQSVFGNSGASSLREKEIQQHLSEAGVLKNLFFIHLKNISID